MIQTELMAVVVVAAVAIPDQVVAELVDQVAMLEDMTI
jgi:hypothetical protein